MTIAVTVKVNDGVVLAADSASTIFGADGNVLYVFENANKICNLLKGSPIGFISWGAGNIGSAGLETLMKDLRRRFSGNDSDHQEWRIDEENYQLSDVASRVREFLFEEQYARAFPAGESRPELGCIVAGYSSGQSMAEQFIIRILGDGSCPDPAELCPRDHAPTINVGGQMDVFQRLLIGFDATVPSVLKGKLGLTDEQVEETMSEIQSKAGRPVMVAPMPIKDAIELARFLVDVTIRFEHLTPGASTVGGPIEIAAITKHEGFKWIERKYYYERSLNPEEDRDE